MIPMGLLVAGDAFLRVTEERAARREEFARRTTLTTRAIQVAVELTLGSASVADVQRLTDELVTTQTAIVRVRLVDPAVRPLADSDLLKGYPGAPPERLRRVAESGQADEVDASWDNYALHTRLVPIRNQRGRPGGEPVGVLELTYLATARDVDLGAVAANLGLRAALLFGALALIIGAVLRRTVLGPLDALVAGIEQFGQDDPAHPVRVPRQDELGRVAAALNALAERLAVARATLEQESERSLALERQLRRTETLAVTGRLASSFAHEVGTPLNVISGQAEFVLHALPANSPLRPDVESILTQVDRVSKIVRSMLDPFRSRPLQLRPIAIRAVVEEVLPVLRHAARKRKIQLSSTVPDDLAPVQADPDQLRQVLINLLVNALEATPRGGHVALRARLVRDAGRPAVAVAVSDDGPGIAPENLTQIFEPFFSTKSARDSTGLGLAICHDIMQQHGGQIQVASKLGLGTTFTIQLAAAEGGNTP